MLRSEKLKATRKQLGITQKELAKQIGINKCTLSMLENHEDYWDTVTDGTLNKVQKIYNMNDSTTIHDEIKTPKKNVEKPVTKNEIKGLHKQDEKTLTLMEFAFEGLTEAKTHDDFSANIQLMNRIVNQY